MDLYIPNYHWCIPLSTNISNGLWLYIPLTMLIHYSHPQIDGKVNHHQISRDLLFHLFGDDYNLISPLLISSCGPRPSWRMDRHQTGIYAALRGGAEFSAVQVVNLLLNNAKGYHILDYGHENVILFVKDHGISWENVPFFKWFNQSWLMVWIMLNPYVGFWWLPMPKSLVRS